MDERIKVNLQTSPHISYALCQSGAPLITSLTVTNPLDRQIENINIRLSFEPLFAGDFETVITSLPPKSTVEIAPVKLKYAAESLFNLSDKMSGKINLEVFNSDGLLFAETRSTEIMPINWRTEINALPEVLAVFVTPDNPTVSDTTAAAEALLLERTGRPFTGYDTKREETVTEQMKALYDALRRINAVNMPAPDMDAPGFLRLADRVRDTEAGDALDLSLFYCSCSEAAGLDPFLIITDGGALAGCRTDGRTFPEDVTYDFTFIKNALKNGEICVIDCTCFTVDKNSEFEAARRAAENILGADNAGEMFRLAVDVAKCRAGGIAPLPKEPGAAGEYPPAGTAVYGADRQQDENGRKITKQEMWERKLLDLGLRNPLLNFRAGYAVQLLCEDLGRLEDAVSDGSEFIILPHSENVRHKISDAGIYTAENDGDELRKTLRGAFEKRQLFSFVNDEALEKNLKKLHRNAKSRLEESGANTLYLALGFLRWYESDKSEKERYAPLVLVPAELIKKNRDRRYALRMRDEDAQINITLLEMLRQNYDITINEFTPPPADESGLDLPLILRTVKEKVSGLKRWDIEPLAFIGMFSFNRFMMWNDLHTRSRDISKNKIVSALISGKADWKTDSAALSYQETEEKLMPSDTAVPLSADSSQLAAIISAAKGESFVLHGPPGTGKSQTITNIIANALYNGKSVLFIAEKAAALSVVQKRLEKIGLGPFSLELHSDKAQKKSVLSQLENTLNIGKFRSPKEYADCASKLNLSRISLGAVGEHLHMVRPCGVSVYDAIIKYEQNSQYNGIITFSTEKIAAMDSGDYEKWREAVHGVAVAGRECGEYKDNPLLLYEARYYSMELREILDKRLSKFIFAIDRVRHDILTIRENLLFMPHNLSEYDAVCDCISAAGEAEGAAFELAGEDAPEKKREELLLLSQLLKEYNKAKKDIESEYKPTIFSYDVSDAALKWADAQQKWSVLKNRDIKKLTHEFNAHLINPADRKDMTAEFKRLTEYKRIEEKALAKKAELMPLLKTLGCEEKDDFSDAVSVLDKSIALRKVLLSLEFDDRQREEFAKRVRDFCKTDAAKEICDDKAALNSTISAMKTCGVNVEKILEGGDLTLSRTRARVIIDNLGGLKSWSRLLRSLDELKAFGESNAAEVYMAGGITSESFEAAYDCALSKSIAMLHIASDNVLCDMDGVHREELVEKYRELIHEFEQLTIKELVARLSAKIPSSQNAAAGSEMGILLKAIKSGGRMMPIRKLFDSIPNLLRRICPCMLMSPISAAEYLDASFPKFDLVVFDEASQIPTCEAVGAISRGENAVIVGDPKQLPPTSFFDVNSFDEDNYEIEDLDSVLDDCLAAAMPQKHLLWHYRSRHESLIAFSNAEYYDNRLLTFPSPSDIVSKVTLHMTDGVYDRGDTKQNKAEAQAVVREIVRRLKDEKLRRMSIGVVTFSLPQQILIDDLLCEEYANDPSLEEYANAMSEPIFVKNLENVQGDERDVILFSIGYGPDKNGKVTMNFGPLNKEGGEKRLNVAISRSRQEMMVFSSIAPDMIDLSKTRSLGVAGLKGFLMYAAGKELALTVSGSAPLRIGVEDIIADKLRQYGYTVDCCVGASGYKLDLAVANPDDPDMYLLGVLCDGINHYENLTVRDREVLQPEVLKGLGWNTASICSLDLFDSRERTLSKIKAAIDTALEAYRNGTSGADDPTAGGEIEFEKSAALSAADRCEPYIPFKTYNAGTSKDFLGRSGTYRIKDIISQVLTAEAPIAREMLYKKVMTCFGVNRATSATTAAFDSIFSTLKIYTTTANGKEFCWQTVRQAENYASCRITKDDGEKRTLDFICPEEIACGIKYIMMDQISLRRDELSKEVAHLFGFAHSGELIEKSTELALFCAVSKDYVEIDGDRIKVRD